MVAANLPTDGVLLHIPRHHNTPTCTLPAIMVAVPAYADNAHLHITILPWPPTHTHLHIVCHHGSCLHARRQRALVHHHADLAPHGPPTCTLLATMAATIVHADTHAPAPCLDQTVRNRTSPHHHGPPRHTHLHRTCRHGHRNRARRQHMLSVEHHGCYLHACRQQCAIGSPYHHGPPQHTRLHLTCHHGHRHRAADSTCSVLNTMAATSMHADSAQLGHHTTMVPHNTPTCTSLATMATVIAPADSTCSVLNNMAATSMHTDSAQLGHHTTMAPHNTPTCTALASMDTIFAPADSTCTLFTTIGPHSTLAHCLPPW
ncbi:hypothetical protein DUNSADRAFT_214 [Dunaliella salina]|uniref:Uncharacterized protein n=1 Tax=Dunaliella salina TaxID=3046 RepID=A0ABQ7GYI1_DUNSA|nr:hypothetical protein DUNSADRAFT_214 [Dunaliella salina]|eukprot:KAF5839663.1 hypothetical protein DUNSADRAFT_214 [Dunaliella salina]